MNPRRVRSRFSPMLETLDRRIVPTVWAPPPPVPLDLGVPVSTDPEPVIVTYPCSVLVLSGPTTSV